MQNRRRKVLLKPFLQIQIGLYSAVPFGVAMVWILYSQWLRVERALQLRGVDQDIVFEIRELGLETALSLTFALVFFLFCNIALSIVLTFHLIGPTVAFRRHIQALADGDNSVRTKLRHNDAFTEVADDLNHLSDVLAARTEPADEEAPAQPTRGDPQGS